MVRQSQAYSKIKGFSFLGGGSKLTILGATQSGLKMVGEGGSETKLEPSTRTTAALHVRLATRKRPD